MTTPDVPAERERDELLRELSHYWILDGDVMRCVGCNRSLHISRANELLRHRYDCAFADSPAPWATLAALLAPQEAREPDIEALAEAVHDAYLATCARLGWDVKPANRVPYAELSEDSKELDRASVRAVLEGLAAARPAPAVKAREFFAARGDEDDEFDPIDVLRGAWKAAREALGLPTAPEEGAGGMTDTEAKATPLSDAAVARIIEAVEAHCGMGRGAWDMVAARDLVEGFAAALGADTRPESTRTRGGWLRCTDSSRGGMTPPRGDRRGGLRSWLRSSRTAALQSTLRWLRTHRHPTRRMSMSDLVTHAESELRRAGLFDDDADYDGAIGGAVMDLVRVFSAQGHSGASAVMVLAIFDKVARFEALGPLTDDPAEWMEVADGVWQNRRKSAAFSSDGGKTWYDVNDRNRRTVRSVRTGTQTEGDDAE